MIHLRPYQTQALEAERQHRADYPEETRLAVVMATGLGKTITMAERARRYVTTHVGQRALILVHTDELAQQAEAKVRLVADLDATVGVVKAERDEAHADIVIGSVQTLAAPGRRTRLERVGLVIVDECHHAVSPTYQAILRWFGCLDWPGSPTPRTPALGFTATLERGDGQGLGGVWQNVAFTRDISWAVRKGFLVEPMGYRVEIPGLDLSRAGESDGRLDAALVDGLAPDVVVDAWLERCMHMSQTVKDFTTTGSASLAVPPSTVLFAPLVRSAQAFADAFSEAGVKAEVVHGGMAKGERRAVLERYENGVTTVVCNAMVLTEGWDSPRTACVIVARPTRSRPLFVQMAGRGLRPWLAAEAPPREQQRCTLLVVADSTTELCTIADLSDRAVKAQDGRPLTQMEDEWDIGQGLEPDPERHWAGTVLESAFDPLVVRSSKVWKFTRGGTPFLPTAKSGKGYVFVVGTSVYAHEVSGALAKVHGVHRGLPDLELALALAEDEAQERGGDIGRLIADKARAWRKGRPSPELLALADRLGLGVEVEKIMAAKAGGKAGKVSDLVDRVTATNALEGFVARIKARETGQW
jgi:superfamily II DNA or RNA helicase